MKRYIARHVLIAQLILTISALCFLQARVKAQGMPTYIVIFPSVGLAPGQSLHLTLFNPNGSPVRAQARAHHYGGVQVVLADGSVRSVSPGTFHSFEINRSDILLPGEEGTHRIQLSPSFRLTSSEAINRLAVSMEIVEITDGTSNTIFVGEIVPSQIGGGGMDQINSGFGNDMLLGITRGKTLRVTLYNPPSAEPETYRRSGHVKIFDKSSNLIAQSVDQVVPQGEFRSFDFSSDALLGLTYPDTNRAQVRIQPYFDFKSVRLAGVLASFEIVDKGTGKTQVLSGQECLVLYLGGIPSN